MWKKLVAKRLIWQEIKLKRLNIDGYNTRKKQRSEFVSTRNRKYTIFTTDFDGTLCESVFPGIGSPNMALINHLTKRRKQGNKIILWTCRCGERLQDAVDWCKMYGLEFDAVNENLPEMIEKYGNDSRKIFMTC